MIAESEALLAIGRLLKTARKNLGLTQEQVADLAGISRPAIARSRLEAPLLAQRP